MTASILSFARQKPASLPLAPKMPWQNQDLAELYRVRERLTAAGLAVEVDSGVSDEGDPWFIYQQASTDNVVVHIARIGTEIHVINCVTGNVYIGTSFREVSDRMLEDAPLALGGDVRRGSNVVLHPSAFLTAFVAAALMLVDLIEHNRAEAGEIGHQSDDLVSNRLLHTGEIGGATGPDVSEVDVASFDAMAGDDVDVAHRRMQKDAGVPAAMGGSHPIGLVSALTQLGHASFFIDMPSTALGLSLFAMELTRMIEADQSDDFVERPSDSDLPISDAASESQHDLHVKADQIGDADAHGRAEIAYGIEIKDEAIRVDPLVVDVPVNDTVAPSIVESEIVSTFVTPVRDAVLPTVGESISGAHIVADKGRPGSEGSNVVEKNALQAASSGSTSTEVSKTSAGTLGDSTVVEASGKAALIKITASHVIEQLLTGQKDVSPTDKLDLQAILKPFDGHSATSKGEPAKAIDAEGGKDLPDVPGKDAASAGDKPVHAAAAGPAHGAPPAIESFVPDFHAGFVDILCYKAGENLSVEGFVLGEDILTFADLATADTFISRFTQSGQDIILGDATHGELRLIGVLLDSPTSSHTPSIAI